MEIHYNEALVMPDNCVAVTNEEMTYINGGYTSTVTGTAKSLKNKAAAFMASWFALAAGYTYSAAVAVASTVGVGLGVIAGIGAGYCAFAGNEYRGAYNYFSSKSQTSTTKYKMTTTSFLAFITGVSYGKA